jgi:glucose/arabinose dehydrogenase
MKVLLSAPASNDPYHNGGGSSSALTAGSTRSSATDTTPRTRRTCRRTCGKILRLRTDGGVPADNPTIGGERTRMFAYGIRNSFGFAFDPDTGDLWETENGPECNDEVNRIVAGENYGWGPSQSCPDTNNSGPSPRLPLVTYGTTIGIAGRCSATGAG